MQFLRAKSDDRSKLLEKLFDTSGFKDAAEWLDQRRMTEERALRDARAEVTAVLGRVGQVVGLSDAEVTQAAGVAKRPIALAMVQKSWAVRSVS